MLWDVIQLFLGAILGAIFGLLIAEPYRLPSLFFLRNKTRLKGEWICAWQIDSKDGTQWSYDKVSVTKRLGKLYLKVLSSSMGFDWEANLIHRGNYFSGNWQSRKSDASAYGTLMLKLSMQGSRFVGFWVGATETQVMAGQVIMANNKTEVEDVRQNFSSYL